MKHIDKLKECGVLQLEGRTEAAKKIREQMFGKYSKEQLEAQSWRAVDEGRPNCPAHIETMRSSAFAQERSAFFQGKECHWMWIDHVQITLRKGMRMKKALVAVILVVLGPYVRGADPERFSIQTDVGTSIMYDFELEGTDITFDVGTRLDIAPGYRMTRHLALELETGFIWNAFSKYGKASLEGDHLQIPMLLQFVWRPWANSRFCPLIFAGSGGVYDHSTMDSFDNVDIDQREDGLYSAFQGGAGFEWALRKNLLVGMVYKYLYVHTQEHFSLPGVSNLDSNGTKTQSVSVRLRYRF